MESHDQSEDTIGWVSHPLLPHFKVFLPLERAVALGDLRLEELKVCHGGREASEGLSATAPDAHQQSVPPGLLDDATDTRQMLQEVPAQVCAYGCVSVCECVCVSVCVCECVCV